MREKQYQLRVVVSMSSALGKKQMFTTVNNRYKR